MGRLEAHWQSRYSKAVAIATHRFKDFTRFFGEPPKLWTLLWSTNQVERLEREVRRCLRPAGAMHSEFVVTRLV